MGSLRAQSLDLLLGFGLCGQAGGMLDLKLLLSEGQDVSLFQSLLLPNCQMAVPWL